MYNPEMLTADTAGAHNSILTVAVRVLLAIFPKAAVLAAFMLSCFLAYIAEAQEIRNPQEKCKEHPGLLALHCAALSGDVAEVQRLLVDKAQVNYGGESTQMTVVGFFGRKVTTQVNDVYSTPLHWAAQGGNADVMKELIKAGADLNANADWSYTPLHFAARAGNIEAVDALMVAGADMKVTSEHGETSLHSAARGGNVGIVEKLIKSEADINALDEDGRAPLHFAASAGNMEVVDALIAAGADMMVVSDDGETLLHSAGHGVNIGLAERLIKSGANINAIGKYGNTPLHFAAQRGKASIVEKLIDAGASVNVSNRHGSTPLHYATENADAVELLIAAGADPNGGTIDMTPLFFAARDGNKDVVIILVNAGAEITHRIWIDVDEFYERERGLGDRREQITRTIRVNAIEIAEMERGEYDPIAIFLREAAKARAQEMLEELE